MIENIKYYDGYILVIVLLILWAIWVVIYNYWSESLLKYLEKISDFIIEKY